MAFAENHSVRWNQLTDRIPGGAKSPDSVLPHLDHGFKNFNISITIEFLSTIQILRFELPDFSVPDRWSVEELQALEARRKISLSIGSGCCASRHSIVSFWVLCGWISEKTCLLLGEWIPDHLPDCGGGTDLESSSSHSVNKQAKATVIWEGHKSRQSRSWGFAGCSYNQAMCAVSALELGILY